MAAGLELPRTLFIHGYLLMDEHKMSKSLGNVLDPFEVMDVYGTDALRYYLLREVAFGQDGSISPEGFETRYTTELANEYGNLASRTLAMIGKYRDGVVPDAQPAAEIAMQFDGLARAVQGRIDRVEVSAALEDVWERVRALNRFVTEREPWQLAKDEAAAVELDEVLYTLAEGLRVVSVLLHPWIPESAERLLAALGRPELSLASAELGAVGGGAQLGELGQLFPRVEPRAEAPA
jgi:methionyl-tRNA synthetase